METRIFSSNLQIPSSLLPSCVLASRSRIHHFHSHRPLRSSPSPPQKPLVLACPSPFDSSSPAVLETDSSLELKRKAVDMVSVLKGTSIYLVGMKSSMKSRIGKLLANVLKYRYLDSDGLVDEAAGGETAAELLKATNEKAFRESETEILNQLASMARVVVCAGDGAVQSPTNLALLRNGISIWVDIPLHMLLACVVEQEHEYPGSSEVLAQIAEQYQEQSSSYATADTNISLLRAATQLNYTDLDAVTEEDMVLEVLKEIESFIRAEELTEEAATSLQQLQQLPVWIENM